MQCLDLEKSNVEVFHIFFAELPFQVFFFVWQEWCTPPPIGFFYTSKRTSYFDKIFSIRQANLAALILRKFGLHS